MTDTKNKGPRSGFALSAEEHLRAEELIGELQERVENLGSRGDSTLKTTCRPAAYEPTIHTIKIGDDKVVVRARKSELKVSHKGKPVIEITGVNLDLIDLDGLEFALRHIRHYMVLDDLANI